MNKLFFLLLFFSQITFALDKVPLISGKLYMPDGYDTNDHVEFFIAGSLPDTCHRNPTFEVVKEGQQFSVFLYAYYLPLPEGCRKISMPFFETIGLGMLQKGQYSLVLRRAQENSLNFRIKDAKSHLQDDYLYGNVMTIVEDPDDRTLELVGTNPVDCLKFEKMEAEIQDKVIVLKPQFKEEGECKEVPTHFSLHYTVPYLDMGPRGMLIHVRVMGGRSLNHLFQNRK